nr:TonB-dependent siderophore receptor [uncultured Neokomagataea sp.]
MTDSSQKTEYVKVKGRARTFVAHTSNGGTKTRTPLIETPQALTVITHDRMALLNARSVADAMRYAAGVTDYGSRDDPRGYSGFIRGFNADTYLDGTRLPDAAASQSFSIEPWGLESMDIIRGASSALYGSGQLGGIINAVSKRPKIDQTNEVDLQAGSFSRIQGAADVGGSLNKSHTLLWRFNSLLRKSNTSFNNILNNEVYVAPSLRWLPNANTDITLLANYEQVDAGSSSQFLPVYGTVLYNKYGQLPVNFNNGDKNFDVYSKRQLSVGYEWSHRLSDNWTISQNMRYAHIDLLYRYVTAVSFLSDMKTLTRQALLQSSNYNNVTLDTRSNLLFKTGALSHELLTGVDFRSDFIALRRGQGTAPSLNVFAPVYRPVTYPGYANKINTNETETQTGLYLQDQISWKKLHITLSGREDFSQSLTVSNSNNSKTPQSNTQFTGRAGLIYNFENGLAPYAAYSTAFLPQVGVTRLGSPFLPLKGRQVEAGLKYKPKKIDLLLTADVFNLVENNVLTSDPTDSTFSIQTGEQRSRGLELEAVGTLPHNVHLMASYTYQEPKITKSSIASQIGARPQAIPMRMASLYLDKSVTFSSKSNAGLGMGVRYNGNTEGSLPNTFIVPSQVLWDLQAHMDFQRIRVQVNATNLFNRRIIAACTRNVACSYGSGRSVFSTLSYKW